MVTVATDFGGAWRLRESLSDVSRIECIRRAYHTDAQTVERLTANAGDREEQQGSSEQHGWSSMSLGKEANEGWKGVSAHSLTYAH